MILGALDNANNGIWIAAAALVSALMALAAIIWAFRARGRELTTTSLSTATRLLWATSIAFALVPVATVYADQSAREALRALIGSTQDGAALTRASIPVLSTIPFGMVLLWPIPMVLCTVACAMLLGVFPSPSTTDGAMRRDRLPWWATALEAIGASLGCVLIPLGGVARYYSNIMKGFARAVFEPEAQKASALLSALEDARTASEHYFLIGYGNIALSTAFGVAAVLLAHRSETTSIRSPRARLEWFLGGACLFIAATMLIATAPHRP